MLVLFPKKFNYDSVHLTGGYYTPLAKLFMKVDGMLSEKYVKRKDKYIFLKVTLYLYRIRK